MTHWPLALRTFSTSDQEAFARISGDRNPIHMDALVARRTQAGTPVVHGLHGVLWALDRLCADGAPMSRLASLKAQFQKFVYRDREVLLRVVRGDNQAIRAELATDGMVATVVDMKFGSRKSAQVEALHELATATQINSPRVLALADMDGLSGWLNPPATREAALRFPWLCRALGEERVGALAQLSALVGMVCPGLHSIFSGFTVELADDDGSRPGIGWQTVRTDERFRIVWMKVAGTGVTGNVQAFVRPAPVEVPGMTTLMTRVSGAEFAARTALVVGGSRGLGAVTAKLLASGGARVFTTYVTGKAEADLLIEEIRAARGHSAASAIACDVRSDIAAQLSCLPPNITHLYYFATPRIFQQSSRTFSRSRLDDLCSVYVDGFERITSWLAAHATHRPISILYPSTIFVADRPKGMTEYAMAKAAGEVLAKDLADALGMSLSTPRIPRVLTDQTASVLPTRAADAAEVMLSLLRAESLR